MLNLRAESGIFGSQLLNHCEQLTDAHFLRIERQFRHGAQPKFNLRFWQAQAVNQLPFGNWA